MVFKLALTFPTPNSGPGNSQRGFPAPGAGAQSTGARPRNPNHVPWDAVRPTKGRRTFFRPAAPENAQRGMGAAMDPTQAYPAGSRVPVVQYGKNIEVETPYYSRGAAAFVQNYGRILYNPIGAGIVAQHRPQASYGEAAQYDNGVLFWTSQVIPTSVNLQGLTSPDVMAAILSQLEVQAAVRIGPPR